MKRIFAAMLAVALAGPALGVTPASLGRVDYSVAPGNVTKVYAFTFPTRRTADIEVFIGGAKQTLGFTVTLNANQTTSPGGTVTFTAAPQMVVRIQRTPAIAQELSLSAYSPFPAKAVEGSLDAVVQQLQAVNRRVADAESTFGSVGGSSMVTATGGAAPRTLADHLATLPDTKVTAAGATAPRTLAERFSDRVSVKDFLCSDGQRVQGDGVHDDGSGIDAARAFAAAMTPPGEVVFPPGTYAYATSPHWVVSDLRIRGTGKVVLKHTGAGVAFDMDGTTGSASRMLVENITIEGNAATTDGVKLKDVQHSRLSNVTVKNVTGACLRINFSVSTLFDNFRCSASNDGWTTAPAVNGIVITNYDGVGGNANESADLVFLNPFIEGMSGDGIQVLVGWQNHFIGGTSEMNGGRGVYLGPYASYNDLAMWLEANTGADLYVEGFQNTFRGNIVKGPAPAHNGLAQVHGAGAGGTVLAGTIDNVQIDAGVPSAYLMHAYVPGAITDTAGTLVRTGVGGVALDAPGPVLALGIQGHAAPVRLMGRGGDSRIAELYDGAGVLQGYFGMDGTFVTNGGLSAPGVFVSLAGLPTYADNGAAAAGGLAAGRLYRTGTGQVMVRY